MSTKINLEYFGMPGSGPTVKEAKADAGRKIEKALEENFNPTFIHFRNAMAVIGFDPKSGHGYRLIHLATDRPFTCERQYLNCGYESYEDCLRQCIRHIAHNERKRGETDCDLFHALPSRIANIERRDFEAYAVRDDETQDRFRAAKAAGLNEWEAHSYALKNPALPELWVVDLPVPEVAA